MMCTRCKKNVAVVFITKLENGKTINEGLCLKCAKEMGIPAVDKIMPNMPDMENMTEEDMENMTNQLADMFGGNLPDMMGGLFPKAEGEGADETEDTEVASEKHSKREGKEQGKKPNKRKMLETFGTNLNERAKEGKVDRVIGRDREIERLIEI